MKKSGVRLGMALLAILAVMLAACGKETVFLPHDSAAIAIMDMSGRQVVVPREVKKVFATTNICSLLVYTIDPAKLAGINNRPTAGEKKYAGANYTKLPILGNIGQGNQANNEKILHISPDLIVTALTTDTDKETVMAAADQLQSQLGIPVVVIDGRLEKMAGTYEFLGSLLGEEERGRELGTYCDRKIAWITRLVSGIPADRRVRVYYALGSAGLATAPAGSRHTEVLDLVNGLNVAAVKLGPETGQAMVSLEQVLLWNPDIIIAGNEKGSEKSGGFADYARNNEDWQNVRAVKTGQVYEIPNSPYNWFDRPPSVNRVIGIIWLANLLYPDVVQVDMVAETKEFYDKFYHYQLTDQEARELLAPSTRK